TTPVFEPRRFRTWFFVATLPTGQRTRDVSSESSSVTWAPARAVVEAVDSEELMMLPPTYLTCLEVGQFGSPGEVLAEAAARSVDMFTPAVVVEDGTPTLSIPDRLQELVASHS
ncbi:MAG: NUDIX hydrolase, partial [Actinomycetota bacterium]|nr:NUDIX hydrolase [Actinomycetota bacterium]